MVKVNVLFGQELRHKGLRLLEALGSFAQISDQDQYWFLSDRTGFTVQVVDAALKNTTNCGKMLEIQDM